MIKPSGSNAPVTAAVEATALLDEGHELCPLMIHHCCMWWSYCLFTLRKKGTKSADVFAPINFDVMLSPLHYILYSGFIMHNASPTVQKIVSSDILINQYLDNMHDTFLKDEYK